MDPNSISRHESALPELEFELGSTGGEHPPLGCVRYLMLRIDDPDGARGLFRSLLFSSLDQPAPRRASPSRWPHGPSAPYGLTIGVTSAGVRRMHAPLELEEEQPPQEVHVVLSLFTESDADRERYTDKILGLLPKGDAGAAGTLVGVADADQPASSGNDVTSGRSASRFAISSTRRRTMPPARRGPRYASAR